MFDGNVSVATGSFVNEDGKILLVSAVAADPIAALESVQVCIDVVRRADAHEDAPDGEVVDVLAQPSDGGPGEVLPETELGLFSTLTDDHLFTFMPFAAYQDCGSDLGEQADAFLVYLSEHADMSLEDAMDQLRTDLQTGPVEDVLCVPDIFPTGTLDPQSQPGGPAYLVTYAFDPFLKAGQSDGWRACALSVWGSLELTSGGAVSSALYEGSSVMDNVSPFQSSDSSSVCYMIRVRGLGNESGYKIHGANWNWSY